MVVTSDGRRVPAYGHVCLAYDDPAVFAARARDFLAAGHAAGERTWYFPTDPRPADLSEWDGPAQVIRLSDYYPAGAVIEPAGQVQAYASATARALADGFTGLRVAADCTSLVREPAQLDAFARYEYLVDKFMRRHPYAAMCAFDRGALGSDTVEELACMHPESDSPFRLFACPPGEGSAALAGELDRSSRGRLATALDRAGLTPVDGELVLAADGLRFIDHGTLLDLDAYGRRRGMTVVLRTALSSAARLAALLELSGLRVETLR